MRPSVIISLMFLGVDFCSDDFSILSFATEEGSRVLNLGDTKSTCLFDALVPYPMQAIEQDYSRAVEFPMV